MLIWLCRQCSEAKGKLIHKPPFLDSYVVDRPKRRFVMPFTKQFFHLRDLQRTGKSPQFGSFKYSAQDLYTKGILLSMDQFSPRQFDRIDVVISSNKIGVFLIEVYNSGGGAGGGSGLQHGAVLVASTEVRMEDLLQAQFENRVSLPLFDGMAKMNLNLLLYQINKKYVRLYLSFRFS